MPRTKLFVICLALALLATGTALAQTYQGDFKVDYFANANSGAPDATIRLDNPGTSGGNLCADIFVFDASEEMSECCTCTLSPDDLRTLSLATDLTANPGNGVPVTTGVIKIVSSAPVGGSCLVPTSASNVSPTPEIQEWVTHVQTVSTGGYAITEDETQSTDLGTTELRNLETDCSSLHRVGSGKGLCTCGTGS
jgi:hypothetical protein